MELYKPADSGYFIVRKHPAISIRINRTRTLQIFFFAPEFQICWLSIKAPTIVFVTGANRGLGLGLVKGFIAKPDYVSSSFSITTSLNTT